MNLNPVGWFEIYVDDMERARAFYESVFQCELEAMTDPSNTIIQMMGFGSDMDSYGTSGALVHMDDVKAGGNSTVVYFSCDDCALESSRVAKAGGSVDKEKFSIGDYGFVALVKDTEGNLIGLHSLK